MTSCSLIHATILELKGIKNSSAVTRAGNLLPTSQNPISFCSPERVHRQEIAGAATACENRVHRR